MRQPFRTQPPPEHVERVGQKMRDTTELDNLQADIRTRGGKSLTMPWRTGRALRPIGMNPETGMPLTPLEVLDMHTTSNPEEARRLEAELDRIVIHDRISEGVLDIAEAKGVPLVVEETVEEAEAREEAERSKEAPDADQVRNP